MSRRESMEAGRIDAHSPLQDKILPDIYNEVYKILCPNDENRITGNMFVMATKNSTLQRQVLSEIWDEVRKLTVLLLV